MYLTLMAWGPYISGIGMSKTKLFPAAYILTHRPTGYFYVGSSQCFVKRASSHKTELTRGYHHSKQLQEVFTVWEDIDIQIYRAVNVDEARRKEQQLLNSHIDDPLCCNVARDSKNALLGANENRVIGDETRLKMSESHQGFIHDGETKMKISLTKSKRVSIDGVEYGSAYHAALDLGLPYRTVRNRLYKSKRKFKDWIFIE